jgi:hypothetical protein
VSSPVCPPHIYIAVLPSKLILLPACCRRSAAIRAGGQAQLCTRREGRPNAQTSKCRLTRMSTRKDSKPRSRKGDEDPNGWLTLSCRRSVMPSADGGRRHPAVQRHVQTDDTRVFCCPTTSPCYLVCVSAAWVVHATSRHIEEFRFRSYVFGCFRAHARHLGAGKPRHAAPRPEWRC